MGECKIDHSPEDVRKKYEEQSPYLPEEAKSLFERFFSEEHTQDILNEVFHLLKKYDLASLEEREERNRRIDMVLKNV
ncbi:group-specific protein [Mesobacillus maritimus]|uniref:Group-specific protein n=1 Tax=Mesobacillus maritimus TaxID=1643336 RepID=A0ABS7K0A3_9BACI|nr:group-specific protein [Mesobacillus maritimus]MBY0095581.1 group-specific protein [Mesobacillus maritimus]